MSGHHLHLIPGFLGRPEDFEGLLACLAFDESWQIHAHDPLTWMTGPGASLQRWADDLAALMKSPGEHYVIGYSFGGRVALHLEPKSYRKLFLLSVHPGLREAHAERLQNDEIWAQRLLSESEADWLAAWNRQDVFAQDRHRPQRQLGPHRSKWAQILRLGSLGQMTSKWDQVRTSADKIHWFVGANDLKFLALKDLLLSALGQDHVHEIRSSGHGLLFDAPEELATRIRFHMLGGPS